jgi:hypothetical protein
MLDCQWFFKLNHDAGAAADQLSSLGDISGTLDEGECDPIGTVLQREGKVSAVLFGDRRQRQFRIGDIDPLAVRQGAAHQTPRIGKACATVLDLKPYPTVVEEKLGSRAKRLEDLGMRQRSAAFIARAAIEIEMEARAGGELDPARGECTQAKLWPLQIGKYADRPPCRAFDPTYRLKSRAMVVLRAVAEI